MGGNFPKRGRNVARKKEQNPLHIKPPPRQGTTCLGGGFLNEGMADHRKSVLIGFVASLFLHVCLVVCVEKCSFAIPLRVEKCKYSLSTCVEKCKIQQVLCVEKCKS